MGLFDRFKRDNKTKNENNGKNTETKPIKNEAPAITVDYVKKLTDEKTLIDIAKNNDDWRVREEAVKHISDESALIDIVKNEPHFLVRETTVNNPNLIDSVVLEDLMLNDSSDSVRMAATNSIKNQKEKNAKSSSNKNYEDFNHAFEVQQALRSGHIQHAENLIYLWGKDFPEDANYYLAKVVLELHYRNNHENKDKSYFSDLLEKGESLKPLDQDLHEALRMDAASVFLRKFG